MATSINIGLANLQADSVGTDLNTGFIDIYDGTLPADPSDPPDGNLLVSCALQADAYGTASGGIVAKNGTVLGTAVFAGVATYAQQRNAANTRWMYMPVVMAAPAAGVCSLDNTTIAVDDVVTVTVSTVTQPTA
jgi:hypothetical protein